MLVLCYHAVSPTWDAALSVTPEALEAQLTMLSRQGWHGMTFTEAVLRAPSRRTLAVTFDDGFLSVLEWAEPILSRLGFPATVFVPTAFMSERQLLMWPEFKSWSETSFAPELRGMSWDDLRQLTAKGWEIGSHTCNHRRLTQLSTHEARAELEQSRLACEEHLGAACTAVAYPYGDEDDQIAEIAGSAGYRVGGRLSRGLTPAGVLRWPRVGIYHGDDAWRFRLKVSKTIRRARATRLWPHLF